MFFRGPWKDGVKRNRRQNVFTLSEETIKKADEREDNSEVRDSDHERGRSWSFVSETAKEFDACPTFSARRRHDRKERRQLWRALPQRTRIAIRPLRRPFGHPAPSTHKNILLKAGKASKELMEAARLVCCRPCEERHYAKAS